MNSYNNTIITIYKFSERYIDAVFQGIKAIVTKKLNKTKGLFCNNFTF